MTILLLGVCVDGYVRKNAVGINAEGRPQGGITGPILCEKCDGKGCPPARKAEPEPDREP